LARARTHDIPWPTSSRSCSPINAGCLHFEAANVRHEYEWKVCVAWGVTSS